MPIKERQGVPPRQQAQSRPTPEPAPINKPKRVKVVSELIGYATIPLVAKAAADEARLEHDQISPYSLDVATIGMYKDPIAEAIVDLAKEYPVIGVLLDRLGVAGPIGALVTIGLTMGAQFAENHGKLSPQVRGIVPVVPAQELAQSLRDEVNERKVAMKAADNGSTD